MEHGGETEVSPGRPVRAGPPPRPEWTSLEPFDGLVEAYGPRVFRLCLRTVAGDAGLAEDLTQEAFLRAHRYRASFVEGRRVTPWLLRLAHNVCMDALGRRRAETVSLDGALHAAEPRLRELATAALSVDSHESTVDRRSLIEAALDVLDPRVRTTLHLRYFEHRPVQEVAEILGEGESAVKVRLMRARRILAGVLGDEGAP